MKRTALQRFTPLERGGPIRMRRRRRLDRETPAETQHKAIVMRMNRCLAADFGPCSGPLQGAHLAHGRGIGLPHGTGEDIAPLCMDHHDQFDGRQRCGLLAEVPLVARFELGALWIA